MWGKRKVHRKVAFNMALKKLGGIWVWDDRNIEKFPWVGSSMSEMLVVKNEVTGNDPGSWISSLTDLCVVIPAEIHTIGSGHVSCLFSTWFQTKLNSKIRLKPVQFLSALMTTSLSNQKGIETWKCALCSYGLSCGFSYVLIILFSHHSLEGYQVV